jgi:hypothetical protein
MKRTDVINLIIEKFKYKTYLEIGVKNPASNFDKIKIAQKDGVDPSWRRNPVTGNKYEMTSDKFFKKFKKSYDIIFIDGLHYYVQTDKDIHNSLDCLNPNGTIVLHDCNPIEKVMQNQPRTVSRWTGDVWKTIFKLRCQHPDIQIFTVDTDYGCCVVRGGKQKTLKLNIDKCLNWEFFEKNRKRVLNLIGIKEFKQWLRN